MTKELKLEQIRIDGNTQSRAKLNTQVAEEYAESWRLGIEFPPLVVFFDGVDYWLAEGFHRLSGAKKADLLNVPCDIRKGSLDDARLHSLGSNATHGLKRTNEDKRTAVGMMLELKPDWSDRQIATHVQVGHTLVSEVRSQLAEMPVDTMGKKKKVVKKRTGKDGKKRAVAKKKTARADAPLKRAQTDDDGNEVPEALLDVFESRDTFIRIQGDLAVLANRVRDLAKTDAGRDIPPSIAELIVAAANGIKLATPYKIDEAAGWLSRGAAK